MCGICWLYVYGSSLYAKLSLLGAHDKTVNQHQTQPLTFSCLWELCVFVKYYTVHFAIQIFVDRKRGEHSVPSLAPIFFEYFGTADTPAVC